MGLSQSRSTLRDQQAAVGYFSILPSEMVELVLQQLSLPEVCEVIIIIIIFTIILQADRKARAIESLVERIL